MEQIRLHHIVTNRDTVAEEIERFPMFLHGGSKEKKDFVSLRVFSPTGNYRDVSMVSKHPGYVNTIEEDASNADAYCRIWQSLKDLDFPVVPTVRKISPVEIIMTDLNTKNVGLYGKGSYWSMNTELYSPSRFDRSFTNVSIRKIHNKAHALAVRAAEHGIVLPTDNAYELCVRMDASWHLLLLDIGRTSFNNDPQTAFARNLGYIGEVTEMLSENQRMLKYRLPFDSNTL